VKKVLLTGASGFIGRQCAPALIARDYEVHSVSSREQRSGHDRIDPLWHRADLLDPEQVTALVNHIKPSHLLHCAWYAEPGKYWNAPENHQWVEASLHLFKEFAAAGGRRAIGVGTCAEYDWSYDVYSETETPTNPATIYGTCKRDMGNALDELGRQTGLSRAWGRLFFVYGPHEDPRRLVPSVILSLLRKETAACSPGEQVRDFLYAPDMGDALGALLDSDVSGAVNIASGQGVAVKQIVSTIATRLNGEDLLRLGALPAPANEPQVLVANVSRLRDEVGWSPRFDLEQGLENTIDWWKAEIANRL